MESVPKTGKQKQETRLWWEGFVKMMCQVLSQKWKSEGDIDGENGKSTEEEEVVDKAEQSL